MSIESLMPSKYLILCHPLLLLPSIFPSIRVFPVSQLFTSGGLSTGASASGISPSSGYLGLISFRTDWFHLAVQGTESSRAPQFESINSLVLNLLYGPTHITVDLYITTGKTTALTIWTFAGKVLSLLFNTLSRFVSFYSKEQASSNFVAAVTVCSDFGAQENKIYHCFHSFPIYLL